MLPRPTIHCSFTNWLFAILFFLSLSPSYSQGKLEITGQKSLSTEEGKSIKLELNDFTVRGSGQDQYPNEFRLDVFDGDNYSVSGTTVTPDAGFSGELNVIIRIVRVKNGSIKAETDRTGIKIEVRKVQTDNPSPQNTPPQIIGQKPIHTPVNEPVEIQFSMLTVVDPDDDYPNGFRLKLDDGENYSIDSKTTVVPEDGFTGTLSIKTVVNDGKADSKPFNVKITVGPGETHSPGTGAPVFVRFDERPLKYSLGNNRFFIARELQIDDPDSEELLYAEVFFEEGSFIVSRDELSAETTGALSVVFDANAGKLVVFGRETLAAYQQTLRTLTYNFDGDTLPDSRRKAIHFRLNDGENFSEIRTKAVEINENVVLDIPNVFSPNEDQLNDTWAIHPQRAVDNLAAIVRVFDKRGLLIFESHDLEEQWDGRVNGEFVPADTYFYTIEIRAGGSESRHKGVVTVLK